MIDVAAVLPRNGGYFRYMGSLTTPPCSEGLTWTVHQEPVEASVEQIQKFASLFPNNARPVQRRNRRFLIDAS
jgi:carbonic anhydrase